MKLVMSGVPAPIMFFSTSDLTNWNIEQLSVATSGVGKQTDYTDRILYAPDCIHHNGKHYLYYCLAGGGKDEGVAVSSSPYGPFKNGKNNRRGLWH